MCVQKSEMRKARARTPAKAARSGAGRIHTPEKTAAQRRENAAGRPSRSLPYLAEAPSEAEAEVEGRSSKGGMCHPERSVIFAPRREDQMQSKDPYQD